MTRFKKIVEKILEEAKQVGLLYHATRLDDILDILKENILYAQRDIGISTSRTKEFFLTNNLFGLGKWNACLVLDGDKLSNKYKIKPFQYPNERDSYETVIITNKLNKYDYPVNNITAYHNWLKNLDDYFDEYGYDYSEPDFVSDGSAIINIKNYLVKILVDKNAIELTDYCKAKYGDRALDYITENKKLLDEIKSLTNVKIEIVNKNDISDQEKNALMGKNPFSSYKNCLKLINDPGYIDYKNDIPNKFKTYELTSLAIKKGKTTLEYVPKKILDYNLCKLAIETKPLDNLSYIPEKYQTKELYEIAINKNPYSLMYIPEKFKTYELCLDAVKKIKNTLEYVPEKFKNKIKQDLGIQNE